MADAPSGLLPAVDAALPELSQESVADPAGVRPSSLDLGIRNAALREPRHPLAFLVGEMRNEPALAGVQPQSIDRLSWLLLQHEPQRIAPVDGLVYREVHKRHENVRKHLQGDPLVGPHVPSVRSPAELEKFRSAQVTEAERVAGRVPFLEVLLLAEALLEPAAGGKIPVRRDKMCVAGVRGARQRAPASVRMMERRWRLDAMDAVQVERLAAGGADGRPDSAPFPVRPVPRDEHFGGDEIAASPIDRLAGHGGFSLPVPLAPIMRPGFANPGRGQRA